MFLLKPNAEERRVRLRPNDHRSLTALAQYYVVDLLHSWAALLMLLGPHTVRLCRPVFLFISALYQHVAVESGFMDWEYYWLRHLEVKLLAGEEVDRSEVDEKLSQIERNYSLIQNNVQMGNAHAYRALVASVPDRDRQRALDHLHKASEAWMKSGSEIAAGSRRIALFRRFIAPTQLSLAESIRLVLR